MSRASYLFAAPLALVLLSGCGSDDSASSGSAAAPAATAAPADTAVPGETGVPADTAAPTEQEPPSEPVVVQALDNTFRPQELTIVAGTEVRWENVGRNDHDVIPVEGDDWGVEVEDFAPGDAYSHVFEAAGTYEYVCTIHGVPGTGMIGTIIVTG